MGRSWRADALFRRGRRAFAAAAALTILLTALAAVLIDREVELERARDLLDRRVLAVSEHMATLVRTLDLALELTLTQIPRQDLAQARNDASLHDLLARLRERMPTLESVFVVDGEGKLVASSRAFPVPPYDMRQREYFRAYRNGETGLFLNEPARGQVSRTENFVATRPILSDGVLRGAVGVAVLPQVLVSLYGRMVGDAPLLIARTDGVVLLRTDGARMIERLPEQNEILRQAKAASAGIFTGTSLTGGDRALHAFRVLAAPDLVIAVAARQSEVLAAWRKHALCIGALALLAMAALAAVAFLPRGRVEAAETPPPEPVMAPDLALLDLLVLRLRAALSTGAGEAALRETDIIAAVLAAARGSPAAAGEAEVGEVLGDVAGLAAAAGLPDLTLQETRDAAHLTVHLSPAPLGAALLDVVLGMARAAPELARIGATVSFACVGGDEPGERLPGTYACVGLAGLTDAGGAQAFALGRAIVEGAGGAVVERRSAGLWRVELWLPLVQQASEVPAL